MQSLVRLSRRAFLAAAAAAEQPKRPNVLLIAAGRGAQDARRLTLEGLRFSRAYAACPSHPFARASILTGRFPHAMHAARRCEDPTLPSRLKRAGYVAGCIGDWGCDGVPDAGRDAARFIRANIPKDFCLCVALDTGLGGLLTTLDETGLAADTVVALTADHGETEGEPREESVRVPLLIRYPRRMKDGETIEFLVSHVDLAPTLLGLCGAGAPPEMHGVDLSDLILNGAGDPPESVYAEGRLRSEGEWRMLVRGLDKLVVNAGLEATRLYNLGQDPQETANLAMDSAERRKRDEMLAQLRRWVLRTGDRLNRR